MSHTPLDNLSTSYGTQPGGKSPKAAGDFAGLAPPPPPLAPSWWRDLDVKNTLLDMTKWMEDLRDIPQFLESSENLEELRSRMEDYLGQVQNTASDAGGMLEQVRDVASP